MFTVVFILLGLVVTSQVNSLKCKVCADNMGFADRNRKYFLLPRDTAQLPYCTMHIKTKGWNRENQMYEIDCHGSCYNATLDNDRCETL